MNKIRIAHFKSLLYQKRIISIDNFRFQICSLLFDIILELGTEDIQI